MKICGPDLTGPDIDSSKFEKWYNLTLILYFCLVRAALSGFTGMGLGLYMGIVEDRSLAPSHAHLNLLGWVTMMLHGLYHRGSPQGAAVLR